MVVDQLVEHFLLTPEICGSNAHISKILPTNFIYQLYNIKDKNKEKEAGNGPSLKTQHSQVNFYRHSLESADTEQILEWQDLLKNVW